MVTAHLSPQPHGARWGSSQSSARLPWFDACQAAEVANVELI